MWVNENFRNKLVIYYQLFKVTWYDTKEIKYVKRVNSKIYIGNRKFCKKDSVTVHWNRLWTAIWCCKVEQNSADKNILV